MLKFICGLITLGTLSVLAAMGAYFIYANPNQEINTVACVMFIPNGGTVANYKENAGENCESLNSPNQNVVFKKFKLKIKPVERVLTLDETQ